MKYRVMGSHVTNKYEPVIEKRTGLIIEKPEFTPKRENRWETILEFENDHLEMNRRKTSLFGGICILSNGIGQINIAENKSVEIEKQVFRADENITYLYTDHIISEKDDKETNYGAYVKSLEEYKAQVFEQHPEVKEYCEIHAVKDLNENIDKIKEMVLKDHSITRCHSTFCDAIWSTVTIPSI